MWQSEPIHAVNLSTTTTAAGQTEWRASVSSKDDEACLACLPEDSYSHFWMCCWWMAGLTPKHISTAFADTSPKPHRMPQHVHHTIQWPAYVTWLINAPLIGWPVIGSIVIRGRCRCHPSTCASVVSPTTDAMMLIQVGKGRLYTAADRLDRLHGRHEIVGGYAARHCHYNTFVILKLPPTQL